MFLLQRFPIPLFIALLLITACGGKGDDPSPTPTPPPADPPAYEFTFNGPQGAQFTVDGMARTLLDGEGSFAYFDLGGTTNTELTPSTRHYAATLDDGAADLDVLTLKMGTLSYTYFVHPDDFNAFFAPGPRVYGSTNIPNIERVAIEYRDATGVLWSTGQGSGAQEGSSFEVTDSEMNYQEGMMRARVKASFNCTVYNSSGASKPITNGRLMLEFQEF